MAKITRFDDHTTVAKFAADIEAALIGVAEKYEIEIKLGNPKAKTNSVELPIHAHVIVVDVPETEGTER
jgi:hypothetical protein